MFGFRNLTRYAFLKVGNFTAEFVTEVVKEVTFNITAANAANAVEIPENFSFNLLPKDQVITTTAVAVSSKILPINAFSLIAGATPNLFI